MAETQTKNLQLDLVDGDSPFDTDKVKSNFEKLDTAYGGLNENVTWKQLLLIENIPSSFTQYKVQWRGYKELLFVYGFYANVLETIIEPVFLFETHNGEGNRIIFGDSDEVEIYASLPNSDEAMFIKNSGRTTNLLRIYGR